MTFGALAAWQGWLLVAAAGTIAAALFLLKLRPPRTFVPSLLLWRRVLDDPRELTLWERIRRAVSLAATVVLALLLALAVARPVRTAGPAERAAGRTLIVIDTSRSMHAATSGGETRWERAVAEARRLVAASGGEVALATTAGGLVEGPTANGTLIETALERLAPSMQEPSAWPQLAGTSAVHLITDGAVRRAVPPGVAVHSVFERAPNVAITAFEVRPSLTPGLAGDAYLEIASFAPAPQQVRLTVSRGPTTVFDQTVSVAPSAVLRQVVPIARGGHPALRARIQAEDDALRLDDEAVAWAEGAQPLTVTVVGTSTAWLRSAFARDPGVRASFVEPAAFGADSTAAARDADVLIFDGWAPEDPPQKPALLFAPPVTTPWLRGDAGEEGAGGSEERSPRWETPGAHPVAYGVDPFTLVIDRARGYGAPSLAPIARSARGTPLLAIGEAAGVRYVLVAFGPTESNLPAAPGFPVLLANALDWLARPASGARTPGLAAFGPEVTRLTAPDGTAVPLHRDRSGVVALLRAPGLYTAEGGGAHSTIAVNAGDPHLSDLTRTTLGDSAGTVAVVAGGPARPWWIYCALAAFVLALVEWWTWQRRITV